MAEVQRDGLPPLEYSECFMDSPSFRDLIDMYDKELEANGADVKALIKGCQSMITATEEFSKVQQSFAHQISKFKFQTIGEEKTEDEQLIMNSFQTFAQLLFAIEDYRHNMISIISVRLLKTLDTFRKEQVHKSRDERKKFERCAEKYYTTLDNYLRMSVKKKDPNIMESNAQLERDAAGFKQAAFDYACKLQDVHATKQYELVEPIVGYIGDLTTFLHQAYDEASSLKSELQQVQFKVQILRETHESEQQKAYELKAQVIEEGEAGMIQHPEFIRQGQLMIQDKKGAVGQAWHRYFCQLKKRDSGAGKPKAKLLKLTPAGKHTGGLPSNEFLEVIECVRCKADDIDRKFCFEVEVQTAKEQKRYVMQAFSEESRKQWLETMEGKEPTYVTLKKEDSVNNKLTPEGLEFVKKCLELIEKRGGMEEEGIYRKPGVIAKCNKLVKDFVDRKLKVSEMDQLDEYEYDNKTISSAVRAYLGKQLCEPLMTFIRHEDFIAAAKINDHGKRVQCIKCLVDELPSANRQTLMAVISHLFKIQALSEKNFMKSSNLGVVFGPTLMRPERESVATIVYIKYQNIVVEVMIDEITTIFPELSGDPAFPIKPTKSSENNTAVNLPFTPPTPPPTAERRSPSVSSDTRPLDVPEGSIPIRPPRRDKEIKPDRPVVPPRLGTKLSQKDLLQDAPAQSDVKRRIPPPVPKNRPAFNLSDIATRRSQLITTPFLPDPIKLPPTPKFDAEVDISERQSSPELAGDKESPPSPTPRARLGRTARAKFDCDAEDVLELSFKKDQILLNVVNSEESGWFRASTHDGREGLVPENYILFD